MKHSDFKVCAVCGFMLEHSRSRSGAFPDEWVHVRPWEAGDHVVVPVDQGEVQRNGRCDFCDLLNPDPLWLVLADSFDMGNGSTSIGHWTACEPCATAVKRRRWGDVYERLRERERERPLNQKTFFPGHRKLVMEHWGRLEPHILGVVPYREELND